MENNLHEPPGVVVSDAEPKPQSSRGLRLLTRLIVAFLAMPFGFQVLWIAASSLAKPNGRDRVVPILLFPSMITAGVAAGWAALSAITPVRIAAWAAAGSGTGLVLDGVLGCLDPGEVLGPSVLVLGLVFMVIGYRQDPHDRSLG